MCSSTSINIYGVLLEELVMEDISQVNKNLFKLIKSLIKYIYTLPRILTTA